MDSSSHSINGKHLQMRGMTENEKAATLFTHTHGLTHSNDKLTKSGFSEGKPETL